MLPGAARVETGRLRRDGWAHFVRGVRYGGAGLLLAAVACFAVISWRWPVVNDAALMHYVVFLARHGMAPYGTIHDINRPGAYVPDWLVSELGAGDRGWRVYDLGLLGVGAAAMVGIAWRRDWFAGAFAGGLFALFHGRDGMGQAGQRDLAIAVLFLVAGAAFLEGLRRERLLWFVAVGLALGASATIKPFGVVLFAVLMVWAAMAVERGEKRKAMAAGLAGFSLPVLAMTFYLYRAHAWGSFVAMCRVDLPFHVRAARPPFWWMVESALPGSLRKVAWVAPVLGLAGRSWRRPQTRLVLLGMGFGLACFFAQHKGYDYQRYPFVAFLLLWVGLECTDALRSRSLAARALGVYGLLFGLCCCSVSYLRAAAKASWPEGYLQAMERDLRAEGGPRLDGRVQCVDSISGCVTVLDRMQLQQATGTLYDEFLFTPARDEAVTEARREFMSALGARPPEVFIVASWLFPEGPGKYGKLALWPAFDSYLGANYRLVDQQRFARGENGPLGFRMYVRR